MLLFAENEHQRAQLLAWMGRLVPHITPAEFMTSVVGAVVRGGAIAAVITFSELRETPQPDGSVWRTLHVGVASEHPRWLTRGVLRAMGHYAFVQQGADKLSAATPHVNVSAIEFAQRLGLKREAVLRHQFGRKRHAVTLSMMQSEWRRSRWFVEI